MTALLQIIELEKQYKNVNAVNGINFSVEKGACFGILGPNGAGKTTTIEVIEDVIPPTSGKILYKGEPRTLSFREEVGIQFQNTALFSFLTVRETLNTFKSLYHNTYDLDELIHMCSLNGFIDQMNDRISGGQKQRFMLALALINKPELIFLDEPSTGLDPQSRRNLWDVIRGIKKIGKTIILTTHYMEEAQILCDDIAIMDHGKIIAQGSPDALIKNYSREVTVILPKKSIEGHQIKNLPLAISESQDQIKIKTDDINGCLETLIASHINLKDMSVRSPNLENVFLTLTGRQLRE
ncbi:MAG: ABC transporter ATP-binding protein [Proteobacteria bacterium]|nr:ABC transporter ATP-binding protein [Pseudomonadota bacterium]